jgi:hypothetical protein
MTSFTDVRRKETRPPFDFSVVEPDCFVAL